jgi:hypothetical protein
MSFRRQQIKGERAKFILADENDKNIVCINVPVFIPAGAVPKKTEKKAKTSA